MDKMLQKKYCRLCGSKRLKKVLDLGQQPLANSYVKASTTPPSFFDTFGIMGLPGRKFYIESNVEPKYPLRLMQCKKCSNLQLSVVVNPKEMFTDYLYVSSTPKLFNKHCEELAKKYPLKSGEKILDIGSNDGCLLSKFKKLYKGVITVGVDPAKNLLKVAKQKKITEVFSNYFDSATVAEIGIKYDTFDLIVAQNVFAHIDNIETFLEKVRSLLSNDGKFIIEFPYAGNQIQSGAFDRIYHEHLSYFLISPLEKVLERYHFTIKSIEYFDNIHCGTIRLVLTKYKSGDSMDYFKLKAYSLYEKNLIENEGLKIFTKNIVNNTKIYKNLIHNLKSGIAAIDRIALFGAAAKGSTFLNYCYPKYGEAKSIYECCYDENPLKVGWELPGTHITIKSPEDIIKDMPDFIVILAWNFKDEIIERCRTKYDFKGKFIIPLPNVKIV